MPKLKPELTLSEPLEEDIGDLSPYLSLPSASSRGSIITVSPVGSADEITTVTVTPSTRPSIPDSFDIPFLGQSLSRKQSLGRIVAPSSPALNTVAKAPKLSRSQTLPRVVQVESKRQRQTELDSLDIDPAVVTKLRKWILGIAIVEFDLDDGPVVEGVYPPLMLLPAESENIAFSAFPDSLQFEQGSQCHSFRIREQFASVTHERRPPSKDGFIYGFPYFLQRKDATSKRGYQQRSMVILTQHQYPALFLSLASIFGPLYESHGTPMLEAACHNIATWRDPTPGRALELGFLGTVLIVEIPHSVDQQQQIETPSFDEKYDPKLHILASTTPFSPPPLLLFEASLPHLWSIWECLVLCEPMIVFGLSPAQTSQAIWWLRDLLRPIPLAGDVRPYFTVQDGDHSLLVNKLPPKPGVLLGVTNPFFEKSCSHWPHILSLGRHLPSADSARAISMGAPAGPRPGWKTKTHRRYISKDRVLLRKLETACQGNGTTQLEASLTLRRHFCSRTTEVIAPLARYLNTLIPTPTEVTRARGRSSTHTLRLKPFNSTHFFTSLKAHGSTLPFKSTNKRTDFYERWLKSPAFGVWLAQQESIVQDVLHEPISPPSL